MANDWKAQLANKTGYHNEKSTMQMKSPEYNVVDDAEKVIVSLIYQDQRTGKPKMDLTTSQIRKFLTAVNVVRNKVDLYRAQNKTTATLSPELAAEIKFLKVNLLYQAGRDTSKSKVVSKFIRTAKLEAIIDDIGNDLQKFAKFCKYVEALVAYHKFLGGNDK